jgi:hypothetical protein
MHTDSLSVRSVAGTASSGPSPCSRVDPARTCFAHGSARRDRARRARASFGVRSPSRPSVPRPRSCARTGRGRQRRSRPASRSPRNNMDVASCHREPVPRPPANPSLSSATACTRTTARRFGAPRSTTLRGACSRRRPSSNTRGFYQPVSALSTTPSRCSTSLTSSTSSSGARKSSTGRRRKAGEGKLTVAHAADAELMSERRAASRPVALVLRQRVRHSPTAGPVACLAGLR